MRRRLLALVVLTLLSTAGCTSVKPGLAPPLTPAVTPAGGQAQAPREAHVPVSQPSARDALVQSGAGRPESEKDGKDRKDDAEKVPPRQTPAVVDREPAEPAPPRPPVQRAPAPPKPVTQRFERRPEPAAPRPPHPHPRPRKTYDAKIVCDMAEGVTDRATVALCRGSLGR